MTFPLKLTHVPVIPAESEGQSRVYEASSEFIESTSGWEQRCHFAQALCHEEDICSHSVMFFFKHL